MEREQWTTYEIKPELRGNDVLVFWKDNETGERNLGTLSSICNTLCGEYIEDHCSVQRVYRGVDCKKVFATSGRLLERLSNEALDELILQRKTK